MTTCLVAQWRGHLCKSFVTWTNALLLQEQVKGCQAVPCECWPQAHMGLRESQGHHGGYTSICWWVDSILARADCLFLLPCMPIPGLNHPALILQLASQVLDGHKRDLIFMHFSPCSHGMGFQPPKNESMKCLESTTHPSPPTPVLTFPSNASA